MSALYHWIARKPNRCSQWIWLRDAALISLGLRLMRRPGELSELRLTDISRIDGILWFRIRRSKTDQFSRGHFIPLEASGSPACPVRCLSRYLEVRPKLCSRFLFVNSRGNQMSVSSISAVVKRVAQNAGLEARLTGHSLRIGGATAAMMGGMPLEQIRAVGGWESDAMHLYLRAVVNTATNMSAKMGL